ncbi:hypothetical protein [Peribacillus frigoritolerans]|uniref:hypothetical protein n=1 Tax=Peribacillus frigoritolerans TaxID=450367 RepID=UPI003B8AFCAD
MSYGKRYELHLTNSEARTTAKRLTSVSDYAGATVGAIIGKGPWYVRTVVAIAGVWTTKKIQKLGNEIKNKNKGNGVYIIYRASYRSGKIKERDRDFSGPYEVRSK